MAHFGRRTRIKFLGGELLIKTDVDDYVTESLDGMVRRSSDLRPPFNAFQPYWFDAVDDVFVAGGIPTPWPDLSQAYAYNMHGGDRTPTLRVTDRMFDSLTSKTSDTIWRVTPRTIQFGSRVPYFIYHQEQGHGNNVWRPMLNLPSDAAAQLNAMVISYIRDGSL
jgi:hypothetical protein